MISGILQVLLLVFVAGVLGALSPLEQQYVTIPDRNNTRAYLLNLTSAPHLAGTPGDWETVTYVRDRFLEFGWQVNITTHDVFFNYPIRRVVQLFNSSGDVVFAANMTEPVVPVDPTSNDTRSVMTYNSYGASGNVTAPLVYANYGTVDDFNYLINNNIQVQGSIVIVRYGRVFRGVKAYLAQKHGAVGVLIYSDPWDDGFSRGEVYPNGPWRPEYGVQRGSVQFLPICPGSPSQARVAVCLGEEHADEDFVGSLIPNIPVHPLSWGDAQPLMQALQGTHPVPYLNWTGSIPNVNYSTGPSTVNVNLFLEMNYTTTPIWNVIATLPGLRHDEIVLMGNHRDAWVFGATDPSSGTSPMLETARALGVLRNTSGWVPQRDIVFCSWDGEEIGLLGSTAWGEENAAFLQSKAIAYVNVDVGVAGGTFEVDGTPSLLNLIKGVTGDLPYPGNTSTTVAEHWTVPQMGVLGSGSDYTVFIDNLGIPSIDISYEGPRGGVYHSIYDSFYWMEHFGDPEFIFHEGLAQLLGVLLMRLADTPTHPLNYTNYGQQLQAYLASIQTQAPTFDYTSLLSSVTLFSSAGVAIDAQSTCVENSDCVEAVDVNALNTRLRLTERRMLLNAQGNESDGLPLRPWFKHVVQAPGIYQGYGSQVFPGIEQGIIDNNPAEIQYQIDRAATVIGNAAQALTELSVTATATSNKCYGQSLGALSLTSQGGFTPVKYYISSNASTSPQLSPSFANLTSGVYVVYVVDAVNITANFTLNVAQPEQLVVSVTTKGKVATANVTGGIANYTYVWSTGHNSSTAELSGHGKYTLTVTDANGCTAETTFNYNKTPLSNGAIAGIVIIAVIILLGTLAIVYYYVKNRNKDKYSML